jgi:hypothetical protein
MFISVTICLAIPTTGAIIRLSVRLTIRLTLHSIIHLIVRLTNSFDHTSNHALNHILKNKFYHMFSYSLTLPPPMAALYGINGTYVTAFTHALAFNCTLIYFTYIRTNSNLAQCCPCVHVRKRLKWHAFKYTKSTHNFMPYYKLLTLKDHACNNRNICLNLDHINTHPKHEPTYAYLLTRTFNFIKFTTFSRPYCFLNTIRATRPPSDHMLKYMHKFKSTCLTLQPSNALTYVQSYVPSYVQSLAQSYVHANLQIYTQPYVQVNIQLYAKSYTYKLTQAQG